MLDTTDTARRIQAIQNALTGVEPGPTPLKAADIGPVLMAAGVSPDQLAGDGAVRHAAVADILARRNAPGLRPRRFSEALADIGYTPDRIERLLAHRGAKLREGILTIFARARTAGISPDPYLACRLILEDGLAEDAASDTRRRILGDYHRLAA